MPVSERKSSQRAQRRRLRDESESDTAATSPEQKQQKKPRLTKAAQRALDVKLDRKIGSAYKTFGGNADGRPIPMHYKKFLLGIFLDNLDETATCFLQEDKVDELI